MACKNCFMHEPDTCAKCEAKICADCGSGGECPRCTGRPPPSESPGDPLGFGRFADRPIGKVPDWYLNWAMNDSKMSEAVRRRAWREVKRRRDKRMGK
jgi:hypothetical protein